MIIKSQIQAQVENRLMPIFICAECNQYFGIFYYPRNDIGEPLESIADLEEIKVCPFCKAESD